MSKRSFVARMGAASAALALLCGGASMVKAQGVGGAGPADPPPGFNQPAGEITGPSVAKGEKAGIEVSGYAPDFKLEPIQPYPILEKWLGSKSPHGAADTVMVSQLVGKVPVMLLFGSYT
jgi:hypothetical protein